MPGRLKAALDIKGHKGVEGIDIKGLQIHWWTY